MTRKVFWDDPYRTTLATRITDIDGRDITLAETIFFVFSGAQESDRGTIANRRVMDAHQEGREIVYTLENTCGLKTGDQVGMAIDWERRYRLMRLHFAAEIVLVLAGRTLAGARKIGAHIAADKARLDFAWSGNLQPLMEGLLEETMAMISADRDILSAFSDQEQGRRYWEIEGFARVPCGGTHLRKTGEVGGIRLRRRNPGRDKERIEIILADEALA